jgi:hypothetical protein
VCSTVVVVFVEVVVVVVVFVVELVDVLVEPVVVVVGPAAPLWPASVAANNAPPRERGESRKPAAGFRRVTRAG